MQLLDSALFGSFLFFTLRSIRRSRRQSADQRQTENKKKRIKIWMTGMIFMIHRKPGFLNVKFVDKDFLCLKFSIATEFFASMETEKTKEQERVFMEENKMGTIPVSRLVISMALPLMLHLLLNQKLLLL